ncbi:hypothetical protein G7070_03405 [Propioniciclava coleopterorum]|uniref:Cardiolipin synthase N-terminal domain-containing protein n=1 Tax=Propioniciclava coleopterorum TaxID=2714937 RepID=A0A6G7Y3Z5_9ACTN|nr:PLDc N-terminal domain-containing protein [Propioniciclava coleopterorum]QIK71503.1 hypothetical protein G7070_03405 [Propioniciclava coleopterorum]
MPRVVLVILLIALIIYSLIEAGQADGDRVRLMPRWLWIVAILLLPGVGAVAWLLLGRPTGRPGTGGRGRPMAPDDDVDFLRGL